MSIVAKLVRCSTSMCDVVFLPGGGAIAHFSRTGRSGVEDTVLRMPFSRPGSLCHALEEQPGAQWKGGECADTRLRTQK